MTTPTTDQINVAIAKACGWTPHSVESFGSMWFRPLEKHRLLERTTRIPVYTHDLNAMHEALSTCIYTKEVNGRDMYPERITAFVAHLQNIAFGYTYNASSQQVAEAFCKAMNIPIE